MHAKFPVTVHMFFFRGDQIFAQPPLPNRLQWTGTTASRPDTWTEMRPFVWLLSGRRRKKSMSGSTRQTSAFAGVFHRHEGDERVDFFRSCDELGRRAGQRRTGEVRRIALDGCQRPAGEYHPLHPARNRELPSGDSVRRIWMGEIRKLRAAGWTRNTCRAPGPDFSSQRPAWAPVGHLGYRG